MCSTPKEVIGAFASKIHASALSEDATCHLPCQDIWVDPSEGIFKQS